MQGVTCNMEEEEEGPQHAEASIEWIYPVLPRGEGKGEGGVPRTEGQGGSRQGAGAQVVSDWSSREGQVRVPGL